MNHPKKERTFVILKPDTIQRSLIGEVVSRFEKTGLKIAAMKMIMATEAQCWDHYNKDDAWFLKKGENIVKNRQDAGLSVDKEAIEYGKEIIGNLVNFMTCGPVVIMVVEGNQAVGVVKKIVGGTEPATSAVGTLRGDFSCESYEICSIDDRAVRNLVHCSDPIEEVEREIKIWFSESEIMAYSLLSEKILYDINLDSILK
ncbi:MAG: nucleoside-diphosphate kinase [Candidatus Falkowbacteria bacterium]